MKKIARVTVESDGVIEKSLRVRDLDTNEEIYNLIKNLKISDFLMIDGLGKLEVVSINKGVIYDSYYINCEKKAKPN